MIGGEGGIRTPVTRKGKPDFESGAFNRARPPLRNCLTLKLGRNSILLPKREKKPAQDRRTLFLQDTARYVYRMIYPGIVTEAIERLHGPALGIVTTKDKARDSRLYDCSRAHNAGFKGYVEGAIVETPAS